MPVTTRPFRTAPALCAAALVQAPRLRGVDTAPVLAWFERYSVGES